MDELHVLRSAMNRAPEPDLATLEHGREALDARIAGLRRPSSLRRAARRRAVGITSAVLLIGAASTGAAILSHIPDGTYSIGTAPRYQTDFINCMARHGWTKHSTPSVSGPDYVDFQMPQNAPKKAADDVDTCRAEIADRYGVAVEVVMAYKGP
jgi:hypothetical protein